MKVLLQENHSHDAGSYLAMKDVVYDQEVEARYINEKKQGVLIKGSEFIRVGGDDKVFKPDIDYTWGNFDVIEE